MLARLSRLLARLQEPSETLSRASAGSLQAVAGSPGTFGALNTLLVWLVESTGRFPQGSSPLGFFSQVLESHLDFCNRQWVVVPRTLFGNKLFADGIQLKEV